MEKEKFNLTKVKLLPNGILAEYTITEEVKGEMVTTDYSVTKNATPHPDLISALTELRCIVAQTFRFNAVVEVVEDNAEHIKASLLQEVKDTFGEILDGIAIRGVSWSGTGSKQGVVLTALFDVGNGVKTAINTPRLRLGSETYGFEEVLGKMLDRVTDEVFAFLFDGKQAQLSLFGEDNLPEEEDLNM
jgi:hypothetical protein